MAISPVSEHSSNERLIYSNFTYSEDIFVRLASYFMINSILTIQIFVIINSKAFLFLPTNYFS